MRRVAPRPQGAAFFENWVSDMASRTRWKATHGWGFEVELRVALDAELADFDRVLMVGVTPDVRVALPAEARTLYDDGRNLVVTRSCRVAPDSLCRPIDGTPSL